MSDLVDHGRIEQIVGVSRHPTEHWGRAVSAEATVYVLHSQQCLDSGVDLRACPYSIALDWGIDNDVVWPDWHSNQDRPLRLALVDGYLAPAKAEGASHVG